MQKEPIHYPKVWIGLVLIVLFSVPWYFAEGAVGGIILGFPLWAIVAVIMAILLSAYLSFMLNKLWVDDEEEVE